MQFMITGQILLAIIFGCLFARGFASGNWSCALIYGVMMGLAFGAISLIWYALIPVGSGLWWKWLVVNIVKGVVLAAVARIIYGRAPLDKAVAGT